MLRFLNKAEETIISLLLLATTILVFIDVVMRFGFGAGLMWSQELTLHLSAWMVLFGASYGIKVGSHIGMDAFVRLFPSIGRRIITGFACILALIYFDLGHQITFSKTKESDLYLLSKEYLLVFRILS